MKLTIFVVTVKIKIGNYSLQVLIELGKGDMTWYLHGVNWVIETKLRIKVTFMCEDGQ